mmetsp:Transcript_6077/g.10428  ORF Transcript_6077/g.10428 Transcript_6077/m.10428 type:complete len:197 (+) Transcript_6077:116-706(+)
MSENTENGGGSLKQVAHPLKDSWILFADQNGTKKKDTSEGEWDDNMNVIFKFKTVEDFWGMYNNVKTPSILDSGYNYRLFRSNIEPKWEDPANANGGRWTITVAQSGRKTLIDQYWLKTVLSCIGERLDDDNQICGIVVSVRKAQDKISLWTRNRKDTNTTKLIGRRLKAELELPENITIQYYAHFGNAKQALFEI